MKKIIIVLFCLVFQKFVFAQSSIEGDVIKVKQKRIMLKFKKPIDVKESKAYQIGNNNKIIIKRVSKDKMRAFGKVIGEVPSVGDVINLQISAAKKITKKSKASPPSRLPASIKNNEKKVSKKELIGQLIDGTFFVPTMEKSFLSLKFSVSFLETAIAKKAQEKYKKDDLNLGLADVIINDLTAVNVTRIFSQMLDASFSSDELSTLVNVYKTPEVNKVLSLIHSETGAPVFDESKFSDKKKEIALRFLVDDVDHKEFLDAMISTVRVIDKISLTYGIELEASQENTIRTNMTPEVIEQTLLASGMEIIGSFNDISEKEAEEIKKRYDKNHKTLVKLFSLKIQVLKKLFGEICEKLDMRAIK